MPGGICESQKVAGLRIIPTMFPSSANEMPTLVPKMVENNVCSVAFVENKIDTVLWKYLGPASGD
jgi:hypothetical protein